MIALFLCSFVLKLCRLLITYMMELYIYVHLEEDCIYRDFSTGTFGLDKFLWHQPHQAQ